MAKNSHSRGDSTNYSPRSDEFFEELPEGPKVPAKPKPPEASKKPEVPKIYSYNFQEETEDFKNIVWIFNKYSPKITTTSPAITPLPSPRPHDNSEYPASDDEGNTGRKGQVPKEEKPHSGSHSLGASRESPGKSQYLKPEYSVKAQKSIPQKIFEIFNGSSERPLSQSDYEYSPGSDPYSKIKFQPLKTECETRKNTTKEAEEKIMKLIRNKSLTEEAAKELITPDNINYQDKHGNTFLMRAVKEGNVTIIDVLLAFKPDLNLQNHKLNSALIEAIELKYYLIADKLITLQGINLDLVNKKGECALKLAIKYNTAIAGVLIEYGANFNLPGVKGGDTLFLTMAKNNKFGLIELILEREEYLERKEEQKALAFLEACKKGLGAIAIPLVRYDCGIHKVADIIINKPDINHLIQIAIVVDLSYKFEQIESFELNLAEEDYNIFFSRLKNKIKHQGPANFESLAAFYKAYLEKYQVLLTRQGGEKFIEYLFLNFKSIDNGDFVRIIKQEVESAGEIEQQGANPITDTNHPPTDLIGDNV